jgi:hypothetical protein
MAGIADWVGRLSARRFLAILSLVALLPRAALLASVPVQQTSDFFLYTRLALGLAAGHGYVDDGVPTAFWPPGWPGFLGLVFTIFGPSPLAGQIANLALGLAACALTWVVGTRMFEDRGIGRLAALIVAVMPNQIAYVPLLSTEIFYEVLLLLGVLLVFQRQWWALALAGVVFGVASLTKAQSPLIPAGVLGVACLYRLGWPMLFGTARRLAVVYVLMACVIAPWTFRNYGLFHAFIPVSTNGGVTLLTGNNPSANGDFTPSDPSFTDLSLKVGDQVETDRISKQRAVAWIKAHPRQFVALMPKKFFRLWAPDGEAEWLYQAGYDQYDRFSTVFRGVRLVNQVFYVVLVLLAVPGLAVLVRPSKGAIAAQTGWVLCAYATAISLVFSGQSRFHFSLIPWLALYAARTLMLLSDRRRPAFRHPVNLH